MNDDSLTPLAPDDEQLLRRFEAAWRQGPPPALDDFVPADLPAERVSLLRELVLLDLEHRRKAGLAAQVETYCRRFPALDAHPDVLRTLVMAEWTLLQSAPDRPTLGEFCRRFPQFRADLLARFGRSWTCPQCFESVPAADDDTVICPQCGGTFSTDSTISRTQGTDVPIVSGLLTTAPGQPGPAGPPETIFGMLGKFELHEVLGQGGFGLVYRAFDTQMQRMVALKVPRSSFRSVEERQRFLQEPLNSAHLRHPGIVTVYETGEVGSIPYIAVELVSGTSLKDWLDEGRRLRPKDAARLVERIADALDHAHRHGVVHRDLKPANILLQTAEPPATDGLTPRVMDFGLARRDRLTPIVTPNGTVLGTPAYMSPEQARGRADQADARSDVFSLGVVFYELLAGTRPFQGSTRAVLGQIEKAEPPPIRMNQPHVPRDLETICFRCLQKSPERRFPSAGELREDLRRFLAGEPIESRPVGPVERGWKWCARHPVLSVPALILIVASLLLTRAWWQESVARQAADASRTEALGHFRETRRTVDTSYTGLSEVLRHYPVQRVRERLLEQAAASYDRFAQMNSPVAELELERGRAYLRLGDVRRELGQLARADEAYHAAETLFAELVRRAPRNDEGRREQAVSRMRRGLVLAEQDRLADAEPLLAGAVQELRREVAAAGQRSHHAPRDEPRTIDAGSRKAQLAERDGYVTGRLAFAAALGNWASFLARVGREREAMAALDEALQQFALVADAPESVERSSGEITTRNLLASLRLQAGETAEALAELERSLAVCDRLQTTAPLHPSAFELRAGTRLLRASVLRTRGNVPAELAEYRHALEDFESLAKELPEAPGLVENVALTRVDVAQTLHELLLNPAAESELKSALAELARLTAEYPDVLRFREVEAAARDVLGTVLSDLGRTDEAQSAAAVAVRSMEELVRQVPEGSRVPQYEERLAVFRSHWARVLHKQTEWDRAAEQFELARTALVRLVESRPHDATLRDELAHVWLYTGELRQDAADSSEAAFAAAVEQWAQAGASAQALNHHAWFLANGPAPALRDAVRAEALAEQATGQAPDNAAMWVTLASARFRRGAVAQCLAAIDAAAQRNAPDARSWFVRSLAEHAKGDHAAARKSYETGEAWRLRHALGHRDLNRLGEEVRRAIEVTREGPETPRQ